MAKKDETLEKEIRPEERTDGDETVDLLLFQDGERYRDDVFVCVNGETCLVKRGETVRIRRKFADVIRQSMEQDAAAARYIAGQARR